MGKVVELSAKCQTNELAPARNGIPLVQLLSPIGVDLRAECQSASRGEINGSNYAVIAASDGGR